ncbi:MAG TPA: hypothetical protein VK540_08455 [Polyangiaceae bacterium]|nr:hypothetical protein [Polyangiaceae bacterium]
MIFLTGAHPDRQESRERDRVDHNFDGTVAEHLHATDSDFIQPIRFVRDQPKFPCCVGQTWAECLDALGYEGGLPDPTWASGVSIWREARRRQGLIEVIELGTRLEYAIEGLIGRGWDPYREGEDIDDEEAGKGAAPAGDDLDDEMFADGARLAKDIQRYRILGLGSGVLDAVDEALRRGWGVGIGTGLLPPFFAHKRVPEQAEQVLGTDYIGGSKDNHAMRVAGLGAYEGRRKYLVQNHWSVFWGGCHSPDGGWLPGCCWVDENVIVGAHDVHVMEVKQ